MKPAHLNQPPGQRVAGFCLARFNYSACCARSDDVAVELQRSLLRCSVGPDGPLRFATPQKPCRGTRL